MQILVLISLPFCEMIRIKQNTKNNKKFQEAQGLLKSGGGFEINTYEDFSGLMSSLMNDEAFLNQAGDKAGAFVAHLAGATDKVLASVKL